MLGDRLHPLIRMHEADGLPFRVLSSSGPHRGRPFVLVHGIGASHRYLARLHAELARESEVHSIDLPGYGGVPKPHGDPDVATMAAALATVLDELGLSGAVVVGHSMGVQWVTELAILRPDLVHRVVLIGPVTDDRHPSLVAQAVALGRDTLGETPVVNATVFSDYLRCGPVYFLAQSRHMTSYRLDRRVALLPVPALVVRGGNDPIAGLDWCRRLRRRAPEGSRLVIVPGHRHVVQHTAAPAVASAVRDFVG